MKPTIRSVEPFDERDLKGEDVTYTDRLITPLAGALRTAAVHTVTSLSEPVVRGSRLNAMEAMSAGRAYAAQRADAARAIDDHHQRRESRPRTAIPGL